MKFLFILLISQEHKIIQQITIKSFDRNENRKKKIIKKNVNNQFNEKQRQRKIYIYIESKNIRKVFKTKKTIEFINSY